MPDDLQAEISSRNTQEVPLLQSPEIVSGRKIGALRNSFAKATPEIRSLLGIEDGRPDTYFIGVFGSCAIGKAKDGSDIDGYLFYQRTKTTPDDQHLNYDLSHTFDSPAQSLFGYPQGHKPPNPEGLEDIEAHDITRLPQDIAENKKIDLKKLRQIAIIFSPIVIGDHSTIKQARGTIMDAMLKRTGKPYDSTRYGEHQKHIYGDFEDHQGSGELTWQLVQKEYKIFFEQELKPLIDKNSANK